VTRRRVDARRGVLPTREKTAATFADAAREWLRHGEHERALKPSTVPTTATPWSGG